MSTRDNTNDRQRPNSNTISPAPIFLACAIIVIIIWSLSWVLITKNIEQPERQGVFGDMFGAVNSLFSGLAFAGLLVTLYFQRYDLALQQEQIKDARKEVQEQ